MQVIYATRAMLNAGLMEEKEEKEITLEDSNDNPLPITNENIQPAGTLAYVDDSFNPLAAEDEA